MLPDPTTLVSGGAVARVALGGVAGAAAAVAMDAAPLRHPEGVSPTAVVASVLGRTTPDGVGVWNAGVVRHGAGLLAGGLYALLLTVLDAALPAAATVGGVDLLSHVLAVALVVPAVYLSVTRLVFPRAGGQIYEEQATAVHGCWLRSSLAFGGALTLVAPLLVSAA